MKGFKLSSPEWVRVKRNLQCDVRCEIQRRIKTRITKESGWRLCCSRRGRIHTLMETSLNRFFLSFFYWRPGSAVCKQYKTFFFLKHAIRTSLASPASRSLNLCSGPLGFLRISPFTGSGYWERAV